MTEQLRVQRRRKKETPRQEERRLLLEDMARTRGELDQAYAQFNFHSDPDLVESCVYTINALRCRYSYLVRQIKQLESDKEEAG